MNLETAQPVPSRLPRRTSVRTSDREPIPFTDAHGQHCLRVPLDRHGRNHAIVDAHVYRRLRADGLTGAWLLNSNSTGRRYVRTNVPAEGRRSGTLLQVARVIVGAGPATIVRYANGDTLDLRTMNLSWQRGRASRRDSTLVADAVQIREQRS